MVIFPPDAAWVYSFCRSCQAYCCFQFPEPWVDSQHEKLTGSCSECHLREEFTLAQLRHYYEQIGIDNY